MSNPFSGSDIPGMNAMGDTLSFVKKLWGNMQVPGMVAPPMSVDELDKKIQDLKTVESWLTVNMNMLRGTIQALEVQRATLAALQSLGESFAQHAQQAGAMAEQAVSATTAATTAATAAASNPGNNADWPMHPNATKAKVAEPDPDDEVEDDSVDMPPEAGASTLEAEAPVEESAQSAQAAKDAEAKDTSTPFVNPAAWWGLLQEQFKQAVSKAMEGEQAETVTDKATDTASDKKAPAKRAANKPTTKSSTQSPATKTTNPTSKAKSATGIKPAKASTKAVVKPATKPVSKLAKTSKQK